MISAIQADPAPDASNGLTAAIRRHAAETAGSTTAIESARIARRWAA